MPHASPDLSDPARPWLEQRAADLQQRRAALQTAENRYSWARLAVAVLIVLPWPALHAAMAVNCAISAAAVAAFVVVVRLHLRLVTQLRQIACETLVIRESLVRIGGSVAALRSNARPTDPTPHSILQPLNADGPPAVLSAQELDDLGIYAEPVGIFGLLNRCSTQIGQRRLRDIVERPYLAAPPIRRRQALIQHLAPETPPRIAAMASLSQLRGIDKEIDAFVAAVRGVEPLPHPRAYALLRAGSAVAATVVVTGVILLLQGHNSAALTLLLPLGNFAAYSRLRPLLRRQAVPWRDLAAVSRKLHAACRGAAEAYFEHDDQPDIRALRADLAALALCLPPLSRRLAWFDIGGLAHAVLNGLVLYDLHAAGAVVGHAARHRAALLKGLQALAEFEALLSMASFAAESQKPVCFPTIAEAGAEIRIRAGRHPLIGPARSVANDAGLDADRRLVIVTGSNMSGKSSYLRMIGVNCLLAQIGAPVLAEAMTIRPVCLVTDVNVRDNLGRAESYFQAEVRQVRRLFVAPAPDALQLGLFDEPFRGTNSHERFACTLAALEYLNQSGRLCVVATHDQELAALACGMKTAVNLHFQESLGADGMSFDYRIKEGRAQSGNAIRILEREGYPPEVLARARQIATGSPVLAAAQTLDPDPH